MGLSDVGAIERVQVRVAAGDPLDDIVLRSYAIGAAHMALGWVLSEGLTVDPETGEVHDLTIRSFGIIRAKDVPTIDVEILDDPGPPLGRASDAVFAAVAAAVWNAVTIDAGARPEAFPAVGTRRASATPLNPPMRACCRHRGTSARSPRSPRAGWRRTR